MKRILLLPPRSLNDDREAAGEATETDSCSRHSRVSRRGGPETTSSSQLIASGGLPCHAPPESPEIRRDQPKQRTGRRSRSGISYPDTRSPRPGSRPSSRSSSTDAASPAPSTPNTRRSTGSASATRKDCTKKLGDLPPAAYEGVEYQDRQQPNADCQIKEPLRNPGRSR
jgi:hypothetical protein